MEKDIKKFIDGAKDLFSEIIENFSKDDLLLAFNYEKKDVNIYSFSEAIKWIKNNIPKDNIDGAIIYKNDTQDNIILYLSFFKDKLILDSKYKLLVVTAKSLDNEFLSYFNNKDLIILK